MKKLFRRKCHRCKRSRVLVDLRSKVCFGCHDGWQTEKKSKVALKTKLDAAYEALTHVKGLRCWICRAEPRTRKLAVDHCHKTEAIRGLLCSRCNYGLSLFRDNPTALRQAADYLETASNQLAATLKP